MARKANMKQTAVSEFVKGAAVEDRAAAMAFFLQEETGSVLGTWRGRMSAEDQRALFGRFIGRGLLVVSGEFETVSMYVSVCFGTDASCEICQPWAAIVRGELLDDDKLGYFARPYRYKK